MPMRQRRHLMLWATCDVRSCAMFAGLASLRGPATAGLCQREWNRTDAKKQEEVKRTSN